MRSIFVGGAYGKLVIDSDNSIPFPTIVSHKPFHRALSSVNFRFIESNYFAILFGIR